jgi:hypothetical protein
MSAAEKDPPERVPMSVVPRTLVEKLQFFESRAGKWLERAAQIGTTDADVEALQLMLDEARARFEAQRAAQQAAQAATAAFNRVLAEVATAGATIIQQVRTKAATSRDNGVYQLALLPSPAKPSPLGPPGEPTSFTFNLRQAGSLELRWACDNPRGSVGTIYHVWRRAGVGNGPDGWELLGTAGERRFVDDTLPAGLAHVTYKVQAIRSTALGPEGFFLISLGTGGRKNGPVIQCAGRRMKVA